MPISPMSSSINNSDIYVKTERGYNFEIREPKKQNIPKLDFSKLRVNDSLNYYED